MLNMRDMLRASLGRSLQKLTALDRLTAAWPVACGPALARHGEIVAFDQGLLRIRIADPAWMDQMSGMQTMLERELARIAEVKLGGIHFELKHGSRNTRRRRP